MVRKSVKLLSDIVEEGQLFITRDLRLSTTPTSYSAARAMSSVSIIKRVKKIGKPESESTPVELAKVTPLNKSMPLIVEEEDNLECGQPTLISDDDEEQEGAEENKDEDSDYNSDEETYAEKDLGSITDEVVDDADAAKDIIENYKLLCKRKMNNWSVLLLIPVLPMIAIDQYTRAYEDYKNIQNKTEPWCRVMFRILSTWGRIFHSHQSDHIYLQDSLRVGELRRSWSTIAFPVTMRRKLKKSLMTYSDELLLPPPTKRTEPQVSVLPHSTLPSPTPSSHTSTSFMPATGTNPSVGAQGSSNCQEVTTGNAGLADLSRFKLKTSKQLSTIAFNQGEYRCTLRSAENVGDLAIKLETYQWRDIKSKPTQDWWRYSEVKGFVMAHNNSRLANLAAELEMEMRKVLMADPNYEGELTYRK